MNVGRVRSVWRLIDLCRKALARFHRRDWATGERSAGPVFSSSRAAER